MARHRGTLPILALNQVLLLYLACFTPTRATDGGKSFCTHGSNTCSAERSAVGKQLLQAEHTHEMVLVNTSKMDLRQQAREAQGMRAVVLFAVLAVLCAISVFTYVKAAM